MKAPEMQRLFACLILLPCSIVLAGCSDAPENGVAQQGIEAAVRVIVEPLQFERAGTRVEAVGTSRAVRSADVFPVAAGEVVSVNFEPGQAVRAGEVLVELDQRQEVLAEKLASVRLADAERLYDRYRRSADSGAVVPTVLDEARSAVETAKLELERARIALVDRKVVAAFDGYVGGTDVDAGDRVNPATLITTLDDRSALLVSFEVPELMLSAFAVGSAVNLEPWSSRGSTVNGELVDIGSRIDPQTRTFVARARVANEDDTLRPGMSFRVAVNVLGELYPVVAETGVQWGTDGAYVWSIVNGEANRVPVKIVQRREGRVLIDADLNQGDVIVVEGIQRMRDGIGVVYDEVGLADKNNGKNLIEASIDIRSAVSAD
ncbi:MAG: efflux RND transporter periplasmic adaptor subunit [Gammaproteobacteria bacterium]|nr:efflux RND transporter periplasmic adaptor subunit [Gammaproteobacteria bacterium]